MCRSHLLAMLLIQSVIGTLTKKHFLVETRDKVKDIGKENDYLSPNTTGIVAQAPGSRVNSSTSVTTSMTTTPTTTTTTTTTTPIVKDIVKENGHISPNTTAATTVATTVAQGKCLGGDSCCTSSNPCGEGEGDCDKNHDCKENLLCGKDNCKRSKYPTFSRKDDCCYDPAKECNAEPACTGGAACLTEIKRPRCVCKKGYNYIGGNCIEDKCFTNWDGPAIGRFKPCVNKWTFMGKTYNKQCALAGADRPWCATKTDENGNFIGTYWGYCPMTCKFDGRPNRQPRPPSPSEYSPGRPIRQPRPPSPSVQGLRRLTESSPDQCITNRDGAKGGRFKPCVKKWIYQGKTYNQCALAGEDRPWCATKTDENHFTMSWGFCPKTCKYENK